MKKLCCFFNYNPLYRYPIYHAMDEELNCDFYFGDTVFQPLKQFPPEQLKGFKKILHTKKTGFKDYKWHQGINSLLKGYSAYLVTGQIDYLANWLLIIYCKLTGKPIYCWTHGISKHEFTKPISRRIYKLFFKSMDGILMYNQFNCTLMEELGVKGRDLYVFHNSLNTEKQTQIYHSLHPTDIYKKHFNNDNPTIIYIGRIQARKKLNILIEAISELNQQSHYVNLVIVGAPTDDNTIENQVIKHDLQAQVWFYGSCYEEEKNAELLYNAAACVCPAEVGLTAIHALSYGTPVVSNNDFETQMPEFEAIQEGLTGSFYEADNTKSLADEILLWTTKTEEERAAIRQRARDEVEQRWSVDYQMGILKDVFSQYLIKE